MAFYRRREIRDRATWESECFPEIARSLPRVQSDATLNSDLQYLKLLAHAGVRFVKHIGA